ncbi:SHOCT domain-containing protein [Mycolicibacterium iranicum]|nr:SHOCT domain-containing protein [Mycolicibacterium iranicum]
MSEQELSSGGPGDDPYASHPTLSALPRDVRRRIADQLALDRKIGAIKTLRENADGNLGLKEAKDIIDDLPKLRMQAQPGQLAQPVELASGKIDKGGTTLTLYRDGTFTTTGMIFTSEPDRLIGFSSDIDSMRRKSTAGRGAAALLSFGLTGAPVSLAAGNNRGVIYVTITGEHSGTKTYTSKNPENRLLTSIRSLQASADHLIATPPPPAAVTKSDQSRTNSTQPSSDVATQLKMLAELHASGALSADEFAAAKSRILSSSEPVPPSRPEMPSVATTKVRCHKCQHVQKVPSDQMTFVCEGCNAQLKRKRQQGPG